jgi:hypothetical protein
MIAFKVDDFLGALSLLVHGANCSFMAPN